MIDFDKYMVQALKIIMDNGNSYNSEIGAKDFEKLYRIYSEEIESIEENILLQKIINAIGSLEWDFFNTPVGQVIGTLKFRDDYIVTAEIAELMGVRTQYANKLLPDLKAVRKHGTYLVRESNFNEWLLKKGKPSLKELKIERSKKTVMYEKSEENIVYGGFEGEEEYKA